MYYVLLENNLSILNSGQHTRIAYQSETAIDLTICSPILQAHIEWADLSSPGSSNHSPVITTILNSNRSDYTTETWKIKDAQ